MVDNLLTIQALHDSFGLFLTPSRNNPLLLLELSEARHRCVATYSSLHTIPLSSECQHGR